MASLSVFWTPARVHRLKKMIDQGRSISSIRAAFMCPRQSVVWALLKLGMLPVEKRLEKPLATPQRRLQMLASATGHEPQELVRRGWADLIPAGPALMAEGASHAHPG